MAVIYIVLSAVQYAEPYVIDEAVFPYVANGILQHGAPYFYNGDSRPNDLGLWHPPLYDYLLAAQIGIFGFSPIAVRSFGTICVLVAFYFCALALRRVAPAARPWGYVLLAALMMLNPLVVSDALVPDIDGTLGMVVIALGLWVATLVAQRPLTWRLVLGVLGLAVLAVSTKFTIAGLLSVLLVVAALVARDSRWSRALWVIVAFLVGIGVSLGLLFALGAALGFDASAPFGYLLASVGSRPPGASGITGAIYNLLDGPGSNLVWIGMALVLVAIVAVVVALVRRGAGPDPRLIVLLFVWATFVVLGYSYISGSPFGFPKYTAVAVPAFAIAIAAVAAVPQPTLAVPRTPRRVLFVAGFIVMVAIGAAGIFLLDYHFELKSSRSLGLLGALTAGAFAGIAIAAMVFALLWSRGEDRRPRVGRALLTGLAAGALLTPIVTQLSSSVVNAVSPFSTRYYYREQGMKGFLDEAARAIPADDLVIAPKDVGLQIERHFYEDAMLFTLAPAELRTEVEQLHAPYLVTRAGFDYSESQYPKQFAVFREYYTPIPADSNASFTLWRWSGSA